MGSRFFACGGFAQAASEHNEIAKHEELYLRDAVSFIFVCLLVSDGLEMLLVEFSVRRKASVTI